jgi:uncharacterized membrane protein
MGFCLFKDIFGEPRKGIHSYRFGGVAIIDYVLTLVLAIVTSKITEIPLTITTIAWFVISIVIHILFCVDTETRRWIGV